MECQNKDQCTKGSKGRVIKRSEKGDIYDKVSGIMDKNKETYESVRA